jgi:hypothetical protein
LFDAIGGQKISRPDADAIILSKKRPKEWQGGHMVEMTMRYENVDVAYSFIFEQLYTKRP